MPTKKNRTGSSRTSPAKSDTHPTKTPPVKQARKSRKSAPPANQSPSPSVAAAGIEIVSAASKLGRVWADLDKLRRPVEFRVSCVRADDLLVCDFVFENLQLDLTGQGAPKLVRTNPAAAATLVVEFPPQSFGEEAFLDKTGESVPSDIKGDNKFPETSDKIDAKNVPPPGDKAESLRPLPSARIRKSGRSRIAFKMNDEETELP